MKDFYHRFAYPCIVMIVSSLLVRLLSTYLPSSIRGEIVTITVALCLFAFGLSLNILKRNRNQGWIKKVILVFVMMFFICWDMGYVVFPVIKSGFDFLGINGFVVYMVYIFCGWSFFD